MAISLEREGLILNAEERNKHNRNLEKIEKGFGDVGNAVPEARAAKLLAEEAKAQAVASEEKSESVQTQINELVVQGDSSVEAAQARVSVEGTAYDTLKERLDTEHQETAVKLAEKVGRAEVYLKSNGININDWDEDTRRIILDMEPGEVNAVLGVKNVKTRNLDNSVVTPSKTTFIDVSTNLFDVRKATINAFIDVSGNVSANAQYSYTDYIDVKDMKNISFDKVTRLHEYGSNHNLISTRSYSAAGSAALNEDIHFVTANYLTTDTINLQINEGETLMPYEEYYDSKLKNDLIDFEKVKDNLENALDFNSTIIEDAVQGYPNRPDTRSVTFVGPNEPVDVEPFDEWRKTDGFPYFSHSDIFDVNKFIPLGGEMDVMDIRFDPDGYGKALFFSGQPHYLLWDVPQDGFMDVNEVYIEGRSPSGETGLTPLSTMHYASENESGTGFYSFGCFSGEFRLIKKENDSGTLYLQAVTHSVDVTKPFRIRSRVEEGRLQGKIWQVGDIEPEWQIDTYDNSVSKSGKVGVYGYFPRSQYLYKIGVSSGGMVAPKRLWI